MDALLCIAIILACYAFYKWATLNNSYFTHINVAHTKPFFLVGSMGRIIMKQQSMAEGITESYKNFPDEQ
jgi:hypothetical protein